MDEDRWKNWTWNKPRVTWYRDINDSDDWGSVTREEAIEHVSRGTETGTISFVTDRHGATRNTYQFSPDGTELQHVQQFGRKRKSE